MRKNENSAKLPYQTTLLICGNSHFSEKFGQDKIEKSSVKREEVLQVKKIKKIFSFIVSLLIF